MKPRDSGVRYWVLRPSAGLAAAVCVAVLGCGRPAGPVDEGAARTPGRSSVREPSARSAAVGAGHGVKPGESRAGKADEVPASAAKDDKPGEGSGSAKSANASQGKGDEKQGEWLTIADVDVSKLDIAVYPGARQNGAANIDNARGTLVSVNLVTSEPYDDVAGFYKARYPTAQIRENMADGTRAMIMEISGAPDLRTVRIVKRADTDDVEISLMRQDEKHAG